MKLSDDELLLEVMKFKLTNSGKTYLKNQYDKSNLFELISLYEYAINCYEMNLGTLVDFFSGDFGNIKTYILPVKDGEEKSLCRSGGCVTCPFSCGDVAETVQNYGCLPDSHDIIRMKKESGHNWGCHSNESKVCGGLTNRLNEMGSDLNTKSGGIIKYSTWYHKGEEFAINEAEIEYKKMLDEVISFILK